MTGLVDVQALAQALNAQVVNAPRSRVDITDCTLDSRQVQPGSLYCALPGRNQHGASFAKDAQTAGAACVLTDVEGAARLSEVSLPVLVVSDARIATAHAAAAVWGDPQRELKLWGVTGTNGKTTTSFLLDHALRVSGATTTLIGTLGHHVSASWGSNARTTPEAPDLHRIFAQARDQGVSDVVMEVSSIAVVEERVRGLHFDVMGFTNLSHDHLDYHGTMEKYFAAKARLFTAEMATACAIGLEDSWGRRLAQDVTIPVTTWSTTQGLADWNVFRRGEGLVLEGEGLSQDIPTELATHVLAANIACVAGMLAAHDLSPHELVHDLGAVHVPGRMHVVSRAGGIRAIVDYAHTPDAIERAVSAVREQTSGRVICVLGAGGDRDAAKRPLMGAAATLADLVVVTDDNPRSEDPEAIRTAVLAGAHSSPHASDVHDIGSRSEAIHYALSQAKPGDTVLILGKGHETGQEIGGTVFPCDDQQIVRDWVSSHALHD